MLSTPPAFNLSQNQTLQFKSVAKISVGTEIRISKFLPARYSLVNEPFNNFFLVFVKFFHRSGEVVFVSAVREATQSSTACQQLFSTFRFFLSLDALLSSRGENLFVFALAVNNFFSASEKFFLELFVRPSSRRSLCTCQTLAPSVRFPLPSGARSVYGLFPDKGQEVFFKM